MTLSRWSVDSPAICTYSLCSLLRSVVSSSCSMPSTPFMGVRSSWLIMARNSDLARFADSASSRALISSCMARCCCVSARSRVSARLLMLCIKWPISCSSLTSRRVSSSPCCRRATALPMRSIGSARALARRMARNSVATSTSAASASVFSTMACWRSIKALLLKPTCTWPK